MSEFSRTQFTDAKIESAVKAPVGAVVNPIKTDAADVRALLKDLRDSAAFREDVRPFTRTVAQVLALSIANGGTGLLVTGRFYIITGTNVGTVVATAATPRTLCDAWRVYVDDALIERVAPGTLSLATGGFVDDAATSVAGVSTVNGAAGDVTINDVTLNAQDPTTGGTIRTLRQTLSNLWAGVATSVSAAVAALRDGVSSDGDTLQKLYNMIQLRARQYAVATIAERNALNISIGAWVYVADDGDGNWAIYRSTSAGVNASYQKVSDPDLLNAVMTAAQIKASYLSNTDTNNLTNALLAKLNGIATAATANATDVQLRDRSTHNGTQVISTVLAAATARFFGRITAGSGAGEELTGAQATTLLDVFTSALKGLVPASGGGTIAFLRADGTWATPAGGSAPLTPAQQIAAAAMSWSPSADRSSVAIYIPASFSGGLITLTVTPDGLSHGAQVWLDVVTDCITNVTLTLVLGAGTSELQIAGNFGSPSVVIPGKTNTPRNGALMNGLMNIYAAATTPSTGVAQRMLTFGLPLTRY